MSDSLFGFTSSFTVPTVVSIAVGSTPITSGAEGRILFQGAGNVVQESANLSWDNTNGRLGIGTSSPIQKLDVVGTARFTTATINGTNGTITIDQVAGGNYLYSLNSASSAWRDFTIQTNGVDVLNVLSTGRVTLGTKTSATNTLLTLNSGGLNAIESSGNVSFKTCNTFFVEGTNRLAIGSSGVQNEIASVAQNASGWKNLAFQTNGTTATLFTTGNFAINTTTDAGFKLDVNGTARVQDTLTVTSTSSNGVLVLQQNNVGFTSQIINRANVTNASAMLQFQDLKTGANSRSFTLGIGRSGDPQWTNGDFIFGYYPGSVGWQQSAKIFNATGNWAIENGAITSDIPTAIFQVNSTTKGFLPPRMTTTQKNAIATAVAGLVVFDTTLNKLCVFTTVWETITSL